MDFLVEENLTLNICPTSSRCVVIGKRDVESLKLFALEEAEKAERKAESGEDKEEL